MSTSLQTFMRKAQKTIADRRGRLVFAMDATASRGMTWDTAKDLQTEMFSAGTNGLDVQLVFFRARECLASEWTNKASDIIQTMQGVDVQSGLTQIGSVCDHVIAQDDEKHVNAMVFIGDACEESPDRLRSYASELGRRNVPCFFFQEGDDDLVRKIFADMAVRSGGAYAMFDSTAPNVLRDLLAAVGAFASGGLALLEKQGTAGAQLLLTQMKRD